MMSELVGTSAWMMPPVALPVSAELLRPVPVFRRVPEPSEPLLLELVPRPPLVLPLMVVPRLLLLRPPPLDRLMAGLAPPPTSCPADKAARKVVASAVASALRR